MWPRPAFALKGARRRVPHCGPQLPETGVVCMGQRPAARCPRVASSAPWVPVRIPVATGFFSCRPDPVVRLHPQGTRGGLPHLPGPLLPRELGCPAPFSNPCLFMDMGTFYPSRKRKLRRAGSVCLSAQAVHSVNMSIHPSPHGHLAPPLSHPAALPKVADGPRTHARPLWRCWPFLSWPPLPLDSMILPTAFSPNSCLGLVSRTPFCSL